MLAALRAAGARLDASGSRYGVQLQAIARALQPLERPGARTAFLQTLRSVIDIEGQRVNANDRLYLLDGMPTMIVWGARDRTIPAEHGRAAARLAPGSRSRCWSVPRTSPTSKTRMGSRRCCTTSSRAPSRRVSRTATGAGFSRREHRPIATPSAPEQLASPRRFASHAASRPAGHTNKLRLSPSTEQPFPSARVKEVRWE